MEELRRASRTRLSSVTVIQLTESAQDEDFGSGDETDSLIRVPNLSQLEGTCHNAYGLDGGWQVFPKNRGLSLLRLQILFKRFIIDRDKISYTKTLNLEQFQE